MAALETGDRAPAFELEGDDGKSHSLSEFKGKTLILYFYPKDNTPGCTQEACDFRDARAALSRKGVAVVGVSPDPATTHAKFKAKHDLNFLLLADPGAKVAAAYGVWGDKVLYGRKFKGIIRSTFVIDGAGKIVDAKYKVSVKGHVDALKQELSK